MLKSKLTAAVLAALAFGYASATLAATDAATPAPSSPQDTSSSPQSGAQDDEAKKKAKKLEAVTVTGSLIPQSQVETAQPVISITAEDMKARGFTTVAEALQQASFATGSVQGPQDNNSFTTGAKTLSMFGLPVGFTKYLIDGRPMGDFPGLYNGSDVFNNLSNIPQEMVDHIDILPGGQSSLYGSDAIAGVVNIVLKKKVDAPTVDVRFGGMSEGGGASQRISFADSFSVGKFNTLIGAQYEQTKPIWGYSRSLTKSYFSGGAEPGAASRDYLVTGYYSGYQFFDPDNCANVTAGYNGDEKLRNRPGRGDYCGSQASAGYSTIGNQDTTANLYSHSTFDVNDNLQLYGDLLYNYEEQKFTPGTNTTFWSTGIATAGGKPYFYDPTTDDFETVQRIFTPEEVGGYQNIMSKQYENSYLLTLGGKGTIGQSNWDYDLGFSHSDDKLVNRDFQRFTAPIEKYFADHVMGQAIPGTYASYPQFSPNYAQSLPSGIQRGFPQLHRLHHLQRQDLGQHASRPADQPVAVPAWRRRCGYRRGARRRQPGLGFHARSAFAANVCRPVRQHAKRGLRHQRHAGRRPSLALCSDHGTSPAADGAGDHGSLRSLRQLQRRGQDSQPSDLQCRRRIPTHRHIVVPWALRLGIQGSHPRRRIPASEWLLQQRHRLRELRTLGLRSWRRGQQLSVPLRRDAVSRSDLRQSRPRTDHRQGVELRVRVGTDRAHVVRG